MQNMSNTHIDHWKVSKESSRASLYLKFQEILLHHWSIGALWIYRHALKHCMQNANCTTAVSRRRPPTQPPSVGRTDRRAFKQLCCALTPRVYDSATAHTNRTRMMYYSTFRGSLMPAYYNYSQIYRSTIWETERESWYLNVQYYDRGVARDFLFNNCKGFQL